MINAVYVQSLQCSVSVRLATVLLGDLHFL